MGKIAIVIFLSSILSKVIGFFREVLIGTLYGASAVTDAFFISLAIPWTLFGVISAGLLSAYLPVYSTLNEKNKNDAEMFTSNLITIVTFVIVPVFYILIFLFSYELIGLFSGNFSEQEIRMAVLFLRITSFVLFFTGILAVWTGKLQYHNLFLIIPLSGVILNLIVILFVYLSKSYSILFLPLSIVVGNLFQFIIVLVYMSKKKKLDFKFHINFRDKKLEEFSILIIPIMISASSAQVVYFIDQIIASKVIVGGISLINYTQKVSEVFLQLFIVTLISLIFPKLAKISSDYLLFNAFLRKSIDIMSFICIPLVIFSTMNTESIIKIIYGSDSFSFEQRQTMSLLLSLYISSLVMIGYREVLNKALFALKNSKVAMYLSILTLIVNVSLSLYLSNYIGIYGIPISGFVTNFIAVFVLGYYLKSKNNFVLLNKNSVKLFVSILLSSIVSTYISKLFEELYLADKHPAILLVSNLIIFLLLFFIINFLNKNIKYVKKIINE
ncbi:murein biosynthesis integral membrane protein MurJ [Exiguobacterium sp. s149]|uniref:murein biosynthesis integral membrane protein MurJ n=1 Tax=Exiguobacterium TaxID=33986 RepID=UPI001BEAC23F|nr:murein biosynthesis integral membrane protein MurJ [Exiguobacterium sp. s149]